MKIVLLVGSVQSLDKIIQPLVFVAFSYGQVKATADWGMVRRMLTSSESCSEVKSVVVFEQLSELQTPLCPG